MDGENGAVAVPKAAHISPPRPSSSFSFSSSNQQPWNPARQIKSKKVLARHPRPIATSTRACKNRADEIPLPSQSVPPLPTRNNSVRGRFSSQLSAS